MPQRQETQTLSYSAAQMFDLVADIERYPDFLPWCRDARILTHENGGFVAELSVGTRLFNDSFTSHVTMERPQSIRVTYCAGPLSHLANVWRFSPRGKTKCDVSFFVDFDFRSPLLGRAMGLFFDKAFASMVAAFEARARALYG
ncbi:MAG: type II toxin-antitoxin system RatA family toxin [Alphaproteobacteria bacterium]|nr:type II toxin-antitoxin system RatA family toxin [Alphaproteobacteria bacterium]